jgi:hypothetical protein
MREYVAALDANDADLVNAWRECVAGSGTAHPANVKRTASSKVRRGTVLRARHRDALRVGPSPKPTRLGADTPSILLYDGVHGRRVVLPASFAPVVQHVRSRHRFRADSVMKWLSPPFAHDWVQVQATLQDLVELGIVEPIRERTARSNRRPRP